MSVFEQELGAGTVTCDDDYTEMFDADLDEYCNDMSRGSLSNCNGESPGCVGTWGASTVPEATGLIRDYIVSWMNHNSPPSDQWVINIALAADCTSATGTAGPGRIKISAWTGTDRVQYVSCATDSDCSDASDVIGPSGWCLAYECDAQKGGYCVIRWQGCRYCEEGNIPCPGPSAAVIAACNGSIVTGCGTGLHPDACHHECVPNTKSFVARVTVGKQWRQGDAPITQFVPLSTSQAITGVGIVSDWWQKRPTIVRVYDGTADSQGTLIAEQSFTEYTNNVCGANFDETCAVGMSSLLLVPVDLQADGVWVEVEGLLSAANNYAKITEVVVLE